VTTRGAEALLAGLVDFAGLFPPAALGMAEATAEYARQRQGDAAWMLGRFVVPAARLDELERAAQGLWPSQPGPHAVESAPGPGASPPSPWGLSVLVGPALEAHAEAVLDFGARHTARARVDAVELTGRSVAEIEASLAVVPVGPVAYVEVPQDGDLDPLLAALRARRARAKVRTGGVTPDAIPGTGTLARFLEACAKAGVAFKATAGLHHPFRGERALTDQGDAPRAVMHGFVNVFAAAALAHAGETARTLEAVLGEGDPAAFRFDDAGLAWRDRRLDAASLAATRRDFAVSFGSCSFREPVEDLRAAGIVS